MIDLVYKGATGGPIVALIQADIHEKFVPYNLLPGRTRSYLEAWAWFWVFRLRSIKSAPAPAEQPAGVASCGGQDRILDAGSS